jgi:hypothetical protein
MAEAYRTNIRAFGKTFTWMKRALTVPQQKNQIGDHGIFNTTRKHQIVRNVHSHFFNHLSVDQHDSAFAAFVYTM